MILPLRFFLVIVRQVDQLLLPGVALGGWLFIGQIRPVVGGVLAFAA